MSANPVELARSKSRLSQSAFAAALGVSLRTIQDWEQGRRNPSAAGRALLRIAELSPAALRKMAAGVGRRIPLGAKLSRSHEPLAGLQPMTGPIPPREKTPDSAVKVMLVVARNTVRFFKGQAAMHATPYPRLMGALIDAYALRQSNRGTPADAGAAAPAEKPRKERGLAGGGVARPNTSLRPAAGSSASRQPATAGETAREQRRARRLARLGVSSPASRAVAPPPARPAAGQTTVEAPEGDEQRQRRGIRQRDGQ